ncbi:MAG: hypothetical protein NTX66_00455, partial [Candidatus Falkowbacteria bacterium]|nr:hypothetical protein [Candidatus Falkowbacteria bacterium]
IVAILIGLSGAKASFAQFLLGQYKLEPDTADCLFRVNSAEKPWQDLAPAPASLEKIYSFSEYKTTGCYSSAPSSWKEYAQGRIISFMQEPGAYSCQDTSFAISVATGYSLMFCGNVFECMPHDKNFKAKSLTYFAEANNRQALIKWIKPVALAAYRLMPKALKQVYKKILSAVDSYLNSLDYDKELAYLKSEFKKNGERNDFYAVDRKSGQDDPMRKAKAFCFRRLLDYKAKTWTKEQINKFAATTGYTPKPSQGISWEALKEFVAQIKKIAATV